VSRRIPGLLHYRLRAAAPAGVTITGFRKSVPGLPPHPRLLLTEPPGPARPDLVLGLVGKAITFDSGGISIKPAGHMDDMKSDMAGGGPGLGANGADARPQPP